MMRSSVHAPHAARRLRALAIVAALAGSACAVGTLPEMEPGGVTGRLRVWRLDSEGRPRGPSRAMQVELVAVQEDSVLVFSAGRLKSLALERVESFHARSFGTVFVARTPGGPVRSLDVLRRMSRFPFGITAAQYGIILAESRQAAADTVPQ